MGEQYGGRRDDDVQALFRYLNSSIKAEDKLKLYFKKDKSFSCEVLFRSRNDSVLLLYAKVSSKIREQKVW